MRRLLAVVILLCAGSLLAGETNPSAKQRELIEKLLVETHVDRTTKAAMDAIIGQMEEQFEAAAKAKGDPDAVEEAKDTFAIYRQLVGKIDLAGLMHEAQIRMYSRYFTEAELTDMSAFYASPTGQKAIDVMPKLMTEAMQSGADNLGPKLEEAMIEAQKEEAMKHPWRQTMADMRKVATALESYATDQEDRTYPAGEYSDLKAVLVKTYITEMPEKDMWGNEYAYVVSADRHHYRLISSGADSSFEWDSRRIVLNENESAQMPVRFTDSLDDDLIFADGMFIQLPAAARSKVNIEN